MSKYHIVGKHMHWLNYKMDLKTLCNRAYQLNYKMNLKALCNRAYQLNYKMDLKTLCNRAYQLNCKMDLKTHCNRAYQLNYKMDLKSFAIEHIRSSVYGHCFTVSNHDLPNVLAHPGNIDSIA